MQGPLIPARATLLTSCDACNGILILCMAVIQTVA